MRRGHVRLCREKSGAVWKEWLGRRHDTFEVGGIDCVICDGNSSETEWILMLCSWFLGTSSHCSSACSYDASTFIPTSSTTSSATIDDLCSCSCEPAYCQESCDTCKSLDSSPTVGRRSFFLRLPPKANHTQHPLSFS